MPLRRHSALSPSASPCWGGGGTSKGRSRGAGGGPIRAKRPCHTPLYSPPPSSMHPAAAEAPHSKSSWKACVAKMFLTDLDCWAPTSTYPPRDFAAAAGEEQQAQQHYAAAGGGRDQAGMAPAIADVRCRHHLPSLFIRPLIKDPQPPRAAFPFSWLVRPPPPRFLPPISC